MKEHINEEDVSRYKLISMAILFLSIAGNLFLAFFTVKKGSFSYEIKLMIQGGFFLVSLLFYFSSRILNNKDARMSWVLLTIFAIINIIVIYLGLKENFVQNIWQLG